MGTVERVSTYDDVPIEPASTLMLLRDGVDGLEVLMLRRTTKLRFAAGHYVYPGGRVDAADGEIESNEAYAFAAVRECFEEAGVLLAVDASGAPVAADHPVFDRRIDVLEDRVAFHELLQSHGLRAATDSMIWCARWIAPKGVFARRFDTRFFVAPHPEGQAWGHDDGETVASEWVRPEVALAHHAANEWELMPPTFFTLHELARHADVASALASARTVGTPPALLPKRRLDAEGRPQGLAFPWEPGYDSLD